MDKAKALLIIAVVVLSVALVGTLILAGMQRSVKEYGSADVSFSIGSVHATITMYRNGVKVFEQYHAGAVTKLGLNTTFAKLVGNSAFYNITTTLLNVTYISIGNKGTLDTDSTVLPEEWNRTSATVHDATYNSCNWTAVFYPGAGPYTADCIGLNYESGIGKDSNLFAYDTFAEVTGIDTTFTITVEFKVSAS